jgi:orotate phosphoribosyltransferase
MTHPILARKIHQRCYSTGNFVLRSGLWSTEYFDKYQFESDPNLLGEIAQAMVGLVPQDTEVLAGLELGGIPIVTRLSALLGIPAAFIRKQAKTYGTARLCEGADIQGRRVVAIEDIVTSGGQLCTSCLEMRGLGASVSTALCVVDREEGGSQALAELGILLVPLLNRRSLREAQTLDTTKP